MIGTYTQAGMDELTEYVSSPINEHLFYLQNLNQLKDLLAHLEFQKQLAGGNWCAPFQVSKKKF
jgi:hypothetical protein